MMTLRFHIIALTHAHLRMAFNGPDGRQKYIEDDPDEDEEWWEVAERMQEQSISFRKHHKVQDLKDPAELMCAMKDTFYSVHNYFSGKQFSDCAIVSSSGDLALHQNGKHIDAHATVMRLNDAPTCGEFTDIVGCKETIRVFPGTPTHMHKREREMALRLGNKSVYMFPFLAEHDHWSEQVVNDSDFGLNLVFSLLDPGFPTTNIAVELREFWKSSAGFPQDGDWMPTSGGVAVAVALSVCDSVALYSFGPSQQMSVAYHYYKGDSPKSHPGRRRYVDSETVKAHPHLSLEHQFWERVGEGHDDKARGIIRLNGFQNITCPR
jgi:hypothetical protein